ncbi:related to ER membrane protein complex subunit 1 [Saccharomycodes ludwigii]|uniref:ER membrane protein complex subunit 1 n=1 Tax=Saccharomycodes ludwigii TaxID=36035 RepID=A0A376B9N6_9ASCO|nr:related to ER membrane protein complex subunit 1 [Saccharomycodes ludwigii]
MTQLISYYGFFIMAMFWWSVTTAVYKDEAYKIDWEIQNIGDLKCIDRSGDSFIVLSELKNNKDKSLLSWINVETGDIEYRQVLTDTYDGFAINNNSNTVYLKNKNGKGTFKAIDAKFGFAQELTLEAESELFKDLNFTNACKNYGFNSLVKLDNADHSIKILDSQDGKNVVLKAVLPDDNVSVLYLETDHVSTLEYLIYNQNDDIYAYFMYVNNTLVNSWYRDESVSDVTAYTVISPHDKNIEDDKESLEIEDSKKNLWDAYIYRLQTNFAKLKNALIKRRLSLSNIVLDLFTEDKSVEGIQKRNENFGFNKLLLVGNEKGVITCLDLNNGTIYWNYKTGVPISKLLTRKNEHELLVFSPGGEIMSFDISNTYERPESFTSIEKTIKNSKVALLSNGDDIFVKSAQGTNNVVLHNKSATDVENYESEYIIDHDLYSITAFKHDGDKLTEIWKYSVDPVCEHISAISGKDIEEPIVNIGVTLGNRTVLYKYLYPHLFVVGIVNTKLNSLTIQIIDSVTGELVYSTIHKNNVATEKPVSVAFGEYWVVYSYFANEPIPEQTLNVIELYESLTPNERMSKEVEKDVFDSRAPPAVISKSYFFPDVIDNIALTKTKFGITTKAIILQLENGQITYLPKYLVSARRKDEKDMTDDDKKEFMASPYVGTIPINDNFVITHFREIIPVKTPHLVSFPTNLESTSFVCSFGHDIFCTKVAPSSQFDVLPQNFERAQIIYTIIGLLVTLYFLKPFVENKNLKLKWLVKE